MTLCIKSFYGAQGKQSYVVFLIIEKETEREGYRCDGPVSAAPLQAEAEVVHSIQILSRQGVISQLPEVLWPEVLASITCHCVIALEEQRGGEFLGTWLLVSYY